MNLFKLKTPLRTVLFYGHRVTFNRRPYVVTGNNRRAQVPAWDHFALEAWERMTDGGLHVQIRRKVYPYPCRRVSVPSFLELIALCDKDNGRFHAAR